MLDGLQGAMRRFSIRTRMNGAIAMVIGLFLVFAVVGVGIGLHLQRLNNHFIIHSTKESANLADIRSLLGEIRVTEKSLAIDFEDASLIAVHLASWKKSTQKLRGAFEALLVGEEDEDNPLARDAIQRLDQYNAATERAVASIQAGGYVVAKGAERALDRPKLMMTGVLKDVSQIGEVLQKESEATRGEIEAATRTGFVLFCVALTVIVLIVVPLTLLNARSIVGPIESARGFAQAIAAGNLSVRLAADGRDEAASLVAALNEMQQSLQGVVGNIRHTAESISVASSQIATGNQDLSGRTEQTASNLQHAASSMEHLTGTVRQTADSARTANQLATSAAEAAQRGGTVVAQVITNMDEITTSSKKIADIIGVIDGIAFQTNILALNAAVEAARAGEQGRGFAVVATEVRNLAQRSANAAREIKSLIGASVEKVESGSRLVHDAGSTMSEIVSGVQRVTDIIGEITAATTEQSGELGQVNATVTQLDHMTQQNAALVEQSAAAAESLKDQAARLTDLVRAFQTEGASLGARPVPATVSAGAAAAPVAAPTPVPTAARVAAPVRPVVAARPKPSVSASPAVSPVPVRPAAASAAVADADWETF